MNAMRLFAATALLAAAVAAHAAQAPAPRPALDYFVVVTGGELLEGAYPDGHTHFITRALRPLGLRCVGSLIADDRPDDLLGALHFATNHAALVLVTGGLGPTPNDITRETLSRFSGVPLREDEAVLAAMERKFGQPRQQLRANLRRQCLVPERGTHLENANGSAVGLVFDLGGRTVVALPGPPSELQPMVRDELVGWLEQRFGVRPLGSALTLRFVGVGQSQIAQTLQERVPLPGDITVTSLFEGGRVDFTFTSPASGPGEVARLRRLEQDLLRAQLEEFFYADDGSTLEQVVLRDLRDRHVQLAVAEVATGGSLGASLNTAAEAEGVLRGVFAAPTANDLARLLQVAPDRWRAAGPAEDQVRVIAEATAARAGTAWAIAIGEGRPAGNTAEVWLAIRGGGRQVAQRLSTRRGSGPGSASLVTPVLDRLRRELKAASAGTGGPPGAPDAARP